MSKPIQILEQFWGFNSFRLGQDAIVDDVIYGHDVLALLPTGGGKSICFQVPGYAREGITIVISPLIALMQDQVTNLNSRGLRAKAITSGMSYREIDITLDNARFGGLDFLYTSPERLQSDLFIERFKLMNVGLIVVDEAHCISEWGHDFRPSFTNIKKLREFHPEVPIIALTATATQKTQEDIIEKLALKNVKIHRAPFERKNLTYESYLVGNKLNEIIKYCSNHAHQTGIVYCQTRKSVKFVARALHSSKLSIGVYHGGMNKEDRQWMLNEWLSGKAKIMIATNAFGMGIDKPDVRYVLHYEFPASLEAYFQEAGRAGRDGEESLAINYWQEEDIARLELNFEKSFPPIDFIKLSYRAICNHLKIAIGSGKNETYPLEINKLCGSFNLPITETFRALKFLELNGDLVFNESFYHPTKVKFAVGNTALYNFQIQHETLLPITTLLLRSYPGIFDNFYEINVAEFSKRLNLTHTQIDNQLKAMEKYGIVDVSWRSDLPTITFLRERMPDDYLEIRADIYHHRKELAKLKLDASLGYLQDKKCRAEMLINYFDIETTPCGKCDICQENLANSSEAAIEKIILEALQNASLSPFELKKRTGNSDLFQAVVRKLVLEEKIVFLDEKYSLTF